MPANLYLVRLVIILSALAVVQAELSSTLWTSWPPLAARSPYLSTWLNMVDVPFEPEVVRAPNIWPAFWNDSSAILGWAGQIRIDNSTTYGWLGELASGANATVVTNMQITPTRTIMSLTAGPIDLNITYLSPIEPDDPVKQSFPITFVSLTATSNDGKSHVVQVYCDVTGEWLAGDRTQSMNWNTASDPVILHRATLVNFQSFIEVNRQIQDATLYFGAVPGEQMTWQVDIASSAREQFISTGSLTNHSISGPMAINSNGFPVFAISTELGPVTTTTDPIVWAVALPRDPVVQFTNVAGETELRSPYWRTNGSASDLIISYLQDFNSTMSRAQAFDQRLAILYLIMISDTLAEIQHWIFHRIYTVHLTY